MKITNQKRDHNKCFSSFQAVKEYLEAAGQGPGASHKGSKVGSIPTVATNKRT